MGMDGGPFGLPKDITPPTDASQTINNYNYEISAGEELIITLVEQEDLQNDGQNIVLFEEQGKGLRTARRMRVCQR